MVFNNEGIQYSMLYTHKSEIFSGNWLANKYSSNELIFSDKNATEKLRLTEIAKHADQINENILPSTIAKNSYVYLSYANTKYNVAFKPYKGNTLTYNYPTIFLEDNKNLIYNNGESKIYK